MLKLNNYVFFGGVHNVGLRNVEKNVDKHFRRFAQNLYKITKRRRA